MAAFSPSWASETTSLTPRRPCRASLRRKSVRKVSASDAPIARPGTSRLPSPLTPTATITAIETTRPSRRAFTPADIRPFALEGRSRPRSCLDLGTQSADLALRMPVIPSHGPVLTSGRDALHVGFLDHRRQRSRACRRARPSGAAPGSRENSCPCAISGCAARPSHGPSAHGLVGVDGPTASRAKVSGSYDRNEGAVRHGA